MVTLKVLDSPHQGNSVLKACRADMPYLRENTACEHCIIVILIGILVMSSIVLEGT